MKVVLLGSVVLSLSALTCYMSWEMSDLVEYKVTFDSMSLIFVISVSIIALGVFSFSKSYMEGEIPIHRFEKTLLLFVFSMYIMISSKSLLLSLVGWDGLGLSSILLVMYYYSKSSLSAGTLTMVVNRLGDSALILASGSALCFLGSSTLLSDKMSEIFSFLLFLAAATKSAQAPFSSWLPAAMAAPTPVSALVHSSTLVTAGVYLLMRYSDSLESGSSPLLWVVVSSVVTLYMASLTAMQLYDMKKIIAHSTLSQISLIFFTFSVGMKGLAFFHLITHAFVKATLFLVGGYIISNNGGRQDLRSINFSVKEEPLLSFSLFLALSSLSGMWFLSVFYSKDLIVDSMEDSSYSVVALYLLLLSLSLTSWYSARLMKLILVAGGKVWVGNKDEPLSSPLGGLAFMVCLSGASLLWWVPSYSSFLMSTMGGKLSVLLLLLTGVLGGWSIPPFSLIVGADLLKVWTSISTQCYSWVLKLSEGVGSQGFMLNMIIHLTTFLWVKMKPHLGLNYLSVGGILISTLLFIW
uniref:NADH dehydrogenase subunit 5 n=1 Tax=Laemobothrion atrum TaxID=179170 RepID=UPI00257BD55E|nr:NADH dehydrogenase subunit 5 [Laemobothrion atrum]WGU50359.1 NADH dehydrogenase subunit 5 [Laemobothrion atrum]